MFLRRRAATASPAHAGRRGSERGSALIEMVIVFPLFVILLFSIVQGAVWYSARSAAQAAAATALNAARTYQSDSSDGIAAGEAFLARKSIVSGGHVSVSRSDTIVTVTVTGRSVSLVPGLPLDVSSTVTGPVERWVG